jgi:hypothetical protein
LSEVEVAKKNFKGVLKNLALNFKINLFLFLFFTLFFKKNLFCLNLERYLNLNLDLNFFNFIEKILTLETFFINLKDLIKIFLFLDLREALIIFNLLLKKDL